MYVDVLRYTTAHLQVLFSLQHLGGITKDFTVIAFTILFRFIFIFINTTQLYSNLVTYTESTTYLCLVLVVLGSPKVSRVRLALLHTASLPVCIIMPSLASMSLLLISEDKGGPTPGH